MPFTTEQFFEVFRRYNEAVWPAQAVLLGLGLAAAYLAWRPLVWSDHFITVALAVLWAWMGVVYHLIFFLPINPAASLFGGLFILEALLILGAGLQGRLQFRASRDARGVIGGILIVYGFLLYPLVGRSFGYVYPVSSTFGLPCPTTIVTLGLMLWASRPAPAIVLVIPIAWSVVGTTAAFRLGMPADIGLGLAGAAVLIDVLLDGRRQPAAPSMVA